MGVPSPVRSGERWASTFPPHGGGAGPDPRAAAKAGDSRSALTATSLGSTGRSTSTLFLHAHHHGAIDFASWRKTMQISAVVRLLLKIRAPFTSYVRWLFLLYIPYFAFVFRFV